LALAEPDALLVLVEVGGAPDEQAARATAAVDPAAT
jgi:hypothetical protein